MTLNKRYSNSYHTNGVVVTRIPLDQEVMSSNPEDVTLGNESNVARISETPKILRELYPDMCFPEKREDDKPLQPKYRVSIEKAKSLGISFIPLEVSLRDTVESLKEKGLLSPAGPMPGAWCRLNLGHARSGMYCRGPDL
ncbi:hypothetical protein TorRG33x02_193910 [Trema orientale]|uniref:NAD(P)-binding domain containing protein n=1 Tax=Trema orientale TaxID=63057 RepID=A0A2P5EH38_TREOI|nr:hypothetical protein TorRG33x02_193910 [Trema orientale]